MQKKRLKKTVGLAAAAAVMCSQVIPAAAYGRQRPVSYDDDEIVRVIVKLREAPVMACDDASEMGAEYLGTSEAENKAEDLLSAQERAEGYIRDLYPDMTVGKSYTTLLNGFSCDLPYGLIDDVENISMVEKVYISQSHISGNMYTESDICGVNTFRNDSGYTGEGEVVAIIDSELDITHDMFAPLDESKKVKLTKADIQKIKNSETGFNTEFDLDVDKAYVNSKLPFVVSYSSEDPYDTAFEDQYHGTHVSGIAAGNEISRFDKKLSGIAPDAQIVFMQCNDPYWPEAISDEYAVAAMEDAVKLNVTSINLSFGMDSEFDGDIYSDILDVTENAGVIVCCAAGNDSKASRSPAYPDISTINSPSSFGNAFSVAAATNTLRTVNVMNIGGEKIYYLDGYTEKLADIAGGVDTEYVYCGAGLPEDYTDKDLSGKLAVIDLSLSLETFETLALNAKDAGAIGVIVIEEPGAELRKLYIDPSYLFGYESGELLPFASVVFEDGDKIKDAEEKSVYVSTEPEVISASNGMCSFSSVGVAQDLELKPDITGIGGDVTSAAYNNSVESMSGTSMASPYITGCTALVSQYVSEKFPDLKGAERARYIRNLLMNTAVPLSEEDMYISPREQGAGLADLSKISNANVYMTGVNGWAKVSLKDFTSNTFEFDVIVKNTSKSDVSFNKASLDLTTNTYIMPDEEYAKYKGEKYIGGSQKLNTEVSGIDALKTLKAGEEKKVRLKVTLNSSQCSEIKEVFVNGFFVEGYLSLSDASNSSDISIPILGYYGDWPSLPIFAGNWTESKPDENLSVFHTIIDGRQIPIDVSFSKLAQLYGKEEQYMEKMADEAKPEALSGREADFRDVLTTKRPYMKYATAEDLKDIFVDVPCVSPNGDSWGDEFDYSLYSMRDGYLLGIDVYDAEGKSAVPSRCPLFNMDYIPWLTFPVESTTGFIGDLSDGLYEGVITGYGVFEGAQDHKQYVRRKFEIDTVPPVISDIKVEKVNGRKVLSFKAADKNLDGIYVLGIGKGCVYNENDTSPDMTGYGTELINDMFRDYNMDPFDMGSIEGDEEISSYRSNLLSTMFSHFVTAQDAEDKALIDSDFFDIIHCTPDKNGSYEFRYDITELEEYSICVMDKAFNKADYGVDIPNVGNISPLGEVKAGDILSIQPPKVVCEVPIEKQGWQISYNNTDWEDFDIKKPIDKKYNMANLRYFVDTGKYVVVSNSVPIRISGMDYSRYLIVSVDSMMNSLEYNTLDTTYHFDNLYHEDFTFIVRREGYVTREYQDHVEGSEYTLNFKLARLGDVDLSGKVDIEDAVSVISSINGVKPLEDYPELVADADRSEKVDIEDAVMIINQINGVSAIPPYTES